MTKEEVLQRANDYCNERSYDESTLTSDFKDKFAEFFVKRNPDGDINDEAVMADLKFNLDTAKSASSRGRTSLQQGFETKENGYKQQIEELNRKLGTPPPPSKDGQQDLPDELRAKLDKLEAFEKEQRLTNKAKEVLSIAKKSVRNDLHKSLENYANDFKVSLDETSEEQAKKLTARFQDIFRDSIGEIKPLAPQVSRKRDEEFLGTIPKVKI